MRKIFVKFGTDYVGEEGADVFSGITEDLTDEEIEEWASSIAYEHAESYGRDTEEDQEGVWWHTEEYDSEKHDMFRAGGGSFEDDF